MPGVAARSVRLAAAIWRVANRTRDAIVALVRLAAQSERRLVEQSWSHWQTWFFLHPAAAVIATLSRSAPASASAIARHPVIEAVRLPVAARRCSSSSLVSFSLQRVCAHGNKSEGADGCTQKNEIIQRLRTGELAAALISRP